VSAVAGRIAIGTRGGGNGTRRAALDCGSPVLTIWFWWLIVSCQSFVGNCSTS
jgi:hypothetical protein